MVSGTGAAVMVALMLAAGATGARMRRASVHRRLGHGPTRPPLILVALRVRSDRHARRALADGLADVVTALAGSARAGATMPEALSAVGNLPLEPALVEAIASINAAVAAGAEPAAVLGAWAERVDDPGVRALAAVVAATQSSGGEVAGPLDRLSASLRRRLALEREISALAAQARLSAATLVALPVVFLPFLQVLGVVSIVDLVVHPVARIAMAAGVGLEAVGIAWMRHQVAGVAP